MNRKRNRLQQTSIGAAMADMAMLLLIFFMVTTNAEPPQGIEVDLPTAKTQENKGDSLFITVASNGDYYFEGAKTDLDSIKNSLLQRPDDKDKTIAISADQDIDYAYIGALLIELRNADFLNVLFVSQDEEQLQ